jgi:branched-chain amino acid transport system permease protein
MDIQVVEFAVGIVTVVLFWFAVRRLWIFKAIWAMGDEPDLIPVLGLPLFRLRDVVFMLSSVFVAVPACLITLDVGVDPHIGISYMLIAAVSVLAGGIGRINGWLTGAMLLAILQSLAVWKFSSRWIDLVTFCLLVFMLLLRPQGLISTHSRAEERT